MHRARFSLRSIENIEKQPCTNRARTVHLDRARTVHIYKNMEYNLLLRQFDQHCSMFISGLIPLGMFMDIELEYLKRLELFIINLN